jgi:hypothetical protein
LVGFAAGRAAGRKFGAGPAYDYMAADDYRTIHFVLDAITKDPGRKRQHLIEIEQRAEEFVDRHWGSVTKVANAMFEAPDHRLDRAQIERVLAPPMRSAPEMLDGVPFLRMQDGLSEIADLLSPHSPKKEAPTPRGRGEGKRRKRGWARRSSASRRAIRRRSWRVRLTRQ